MSRPSVKRFAYRTAQAARVRFYLAHYLAAARVQSKPARMSSRTLPSAAAVRDARRALFDAEWRDIEAGAYALPHDLLPAPVSLARSSRAFLRDARQVTARRLAGIVRDLPPETGQYPAYFLQNFHYQSGGYLTEESAALYDFQVETLFNGAADAMRRRALVPLRGLIAGRDQRRLSLLDIGCGTGRFLTFVLDNYPKLRVTALDLSPAYLATAKRALKLWPQARVLRANAEQLPLASESQDFVSALYLFHELPPAVRTNVAREVARALKPGGTLLFIDSIQFGDVPGFDALLEAFPEDFHEPYFLSYARADLRELWGDAGLTLANTELAFLSKVCVFRK